MKRVVLAHDNHHHQHHQQQEQANKSQYTDLLFDTDATTCATPRVKLVSKTLATTTTTALKRIRQQHTSYNDDESDSFSWASSESAVKRARAQPPTETDESDDEELDERQLWLIANEYDKPLSEWKLVAEALGVSEQDVECIEHVHARAPKECLYQTLLKWRLREPDNCQLAYLSRVLANAAQLHKSSELVARVQKRAADSPSDAHNKATLSAYLKKARRSSMCDGDDALEARSKRLDERQLWRTSELLYAEWKSVGRVLGVREAELAQIECRHANVEGMRECCYQTLLAWSQVNNDKCTLEHLCLAMLHMRFNLFAKKLVQLFIAA